MQQQKMRFKVVRGRDVPLGSDVAPFGPDSYSRVSAERAAAEMNIAGCKSWSWGTLNQSLRDYWCVVVDDGPERTPPPETPGHWNGKCPSCGKGTYTGFMQVEHEGGHCG